MCRRDAASGTRARDARFTFQELDIDSLAGINIVFAVESEFNITVPDDAAQQVRTVRDLVEGVQKLVAGQSN